VNKVAQRVSLVEHELFTLPQYPCSHPVCSGVRVARSLGYCVVFSRSLFDLLLLAIVLSVRLLTDADYPFGVFKVFLVVHYRMSGCCLTRSFQLSLREKVTCLWGMIILFVEN